LANGENTPSCVTFLLDYCRLEWQRALNDLENPPDIAYQDIRNKFDLVWCIKGHGWALLREVLSFA
jgi:hypothetical protein